MDPTIYLNLELAAEYAGKIVAPAFWTVAGLLVLWKFPRWAREARAWLRGQHTPR